MEERGLTQAMKPPAIQKVPHDGLRTTYLTRGYNVLLSGLAFICLFFIFKALLTWAFTEAKWGVIPANLQLFGIGAYPREQIWRVWSVIYILCVLVGLSAGIWGGLVLRFAVVLGGIWFIGALLPFELSTRGWFLGAGRHNSSLSVPWTWAEQGYALGFWEVGCSPFP